MISLIKKSGISVPESVLEVRPDAPRALSNDFISYCFIALGGTCREQKEYSKALEAFEGARTVLEEAGKVYHLSHVDHLIAGVKEEMGAGPSKTEARRHVEVLRRDIADFDEVFGANYAGNFKKRNELAYYLFHLGDEECVSESFEILEDIEQRCKAVFGADHSETKKATNYLEDARSAHAERERMKTKSRRSKKKKSSASKNQESDKHAAKTEEEADAAAAALLAELDLEEAKSAQKKTEKRKGKKKK